MAASFLSASFVALPKLPIVHDNTSFPNGGRGQDNHREYPLWEARDPLFDPTNPFNIKDEDPLADILSPPQKKRQDLHAPQRGIKRLYTPEKNLFCPYCKHSLARRHALGQTRKNPQRVQRPFLSQWHKKSERKRRIQKLLYAQKKGGKRALDVKKSVQKSKTIQRPPTQKIFRFHKRNPQSGALVPHIFIFL